MGLLQFRFQYQYQLSPVKIWFIIITLLTILNINWFVLKKRKNHLTRMLFQPEPIWIQFELIIRFEWFFPFLRIDQLIFKIIRVTIINHILTRESGLNLDAYSSKPTNPKFDWVYLNPIRIRICQPLISQTIALSFLLLFACTCKYCSCDPLAYTKILVGYLKISKCWNDGTIPHKLDLVINYRCGICLPI